MGCGDGCLLNDEGYRAIEGSSRPPLYQLDCAEAAAAAPLSAGDVSQDYVEVATSRTPAVQVLRAFRETCGVTSSARTSSTKRTTS